jgi:hypothetical protein
MNYQWYKNGHMGIKCTFEQQDLCPPVIACLNLQVW